MSPWTKSIFSKNFFNLSLNQGLNIFATIIYTPILFQRLGDENFGLINLAFSIIIILSIIVSYGYNLNGPIKIAQSKDLETENFIIRDILSLRIFNALIIFIISAPLIIFFSSNNFYKILIFSFIILLNEALNPLFYLQGKNKIFPQAVINFFSKIFYIILIYFFVLSSSEAYLANFFYGLSALLFVFFFWVNHFIKYSFSKIRVSFTNIKDRINENFVQIVKNKHRKSVDYMLSNMQNFIDVIIPRGGKNLVKKVQTLSKVPIIGHLEGICHTYIDKDADLKMAIKVVHNAKLRNTSICGATETILMHKNIVKKFCNPILNKLTESNCEIIGDNIIRKTFKGLSKRSNKKSWSTEYLYSKVSVKTVNNIDEAMYHINKFGTMHTDSIISKNKKSADYFLKKN